MNMAQVCGEISCIPKSALMEQIPSSDIVWGEQNFMEVLCWNNNASGSVPVPLSKPLAAGQETKVK
jgi:hypothetical protein